MPKISMELCMKGRASVLKMQHDAIKLILFFVAQSCTLCFVSTVVSQVNHESQRKFIGVHPRR